MVLKEVRELPAKPRAPTEQMALDRVLYAE